MSKILVTGATGFTGGHLCKRLVADGEQVVAFVRSSSNTRALEDIGVECRIVDIRDPQSVNENFYNIDRVYHIAAAWRSEHADRDEFRRVNVEATRNLLEAARKVNASAKPPAGTRPAPPCRPAARPQSALAAQYARGPRRAPFAG